MRGWNFSGTRPIGCPVLTDVHLPEQCAMVAEAVDICKSLPFYAGDRLLKRRQKQRRGKYQKRPVSAPWDMRHVAEKVHNLATSGFANRTRNSFGYNSLVSDMRALPQLADIGFPVFLMLPILSSNQAGWVGFWWRANLSRFWPDGCGSWRSC